MVFFSDFSSLLWRRLLWCKRLWWIGFCGVLCGLWFVVPWSTLAAERIVSLDVCTDQLVLLLAKKADIVGLSYLARDCTISVMCQQARHIPVLRAHTEAVLQALPSVLLVGPFEASKAQFVAKVLGTKVLVMPSVSSLSDVTVQIMRVARAVGQIARGKELVADFQKRMKQLTVPITDFAPRAVIYEANGFVMPVGSLADDVMTHAGIKNEAKALGVGSVARRVPLEILLRDKPDFLVRDDNAQGYSIAQAMLNTPLLRAAFPPSHRIDIPARLWLCGLPQTLNVLARLRRVRDQFVTKNHPLFEQHSLTNLLPFQPSSP